METGHAGDASPAEDEPRWRELARAFVWYDLVLPDRQLEVLGAIPGEFSQRSQGTTTRGRNGSEDRRAGLRVLFTGGAGTGKTMAARILAAELGCGVLQADLLDEFETEHAKTEASIDGIFAAAESSGAIVLFEHADAFPSERSRDARTDARRAAAEFARLVERSEHHPGIVIFASRLKHRSAGLADHFDFLVDFPFPESAARKELWRKLLPPDAQVTEADLDFLAISFKLAGGTISTCCARANSEALREDIPVGLPHVAYAVEDEYRTRAVSENTRRALHELRSMAAPPALKDDTAAEQDRPRRSSWRARRQARQEQLRSTSAPSEVEQDIAPEPERPPEPELPPSPSRRDRRPGRQELLRSRRLERASELERAAERERSAELERAAERERSAELERAAERERSAELERAAERERSAELERAAERERSAEPERAPRPPGRARRQTGRLSGARAARLQFAILALAGAVAAVLGFLVAHDTGGHARLAALTRHAAAGDVLVSFPSDWRRRVPPATPQLGLANELALAPATSTKSTLLIGTAPASGNSPLPASVLAAIPSPPQPQIVRLGGVGFYRYLNLSTGDQHMSVYALPTSVGTVVGVCVTKSSPLAFTGNCERLLGTIRLATGSVLALGPTATYASALSAVMSKLNAVRLSAGAKLASAHNAGTQASAANVLASAHAQAATALLALNAGSASAANAAVAGALRMTGDAYAALSKAATRRDATAYGAASGGLKRATSALNAAFAQLRKLGYRVA